MNCPQCGARQLKPGARFCHACGAPAPPASIAPPVTVPTAERRGARWFWPAFTLLLAVALVAGVVAVLLYQGQTPGDAETWFDARRGDAQVAVQRLLVGPPPPPMATARPSPTEGLPPATFAAAELALPTRALPATRELPPATFAAAALTIADATSLPTEPAGETAMPQSALLQPTATPLPVATEAPTPIPRPPRRLAYVSEATGDPQIWLVDADGAHRRQLTSQAGHLGPAWSADNAYLYYISNRDGQPGVYRQELATGAEEPVVTGQAVVGPLEEAGGQLAYVRRGGAGFELVWGQRPVYSLDRRFDFHWSEARREFLIDPLSDPRVLYVVNPQDGAVREVAGAKSWNGSWVPDGRIVYTSDRLGTAFVFVAAPNGADARTIVPTDKWSQSSSWSPDGRWIGYVAGDGPAWNLYRVAGNGSGRSRVGQAINPNESPIWEPNGQRMAYETTRRGNTDIVVVDLQGREIMLAASGADDYSPAWSN